MAEVPPTPLPPIRFSVGAADAVADELQVSAGLLEQVLAQLDADLVHVREDWRGRFRDTFELEILRARLGMTFLASSMREASGQVRTQILRAEAENRLRMQGRSGL